MFNKLLKHKYLYLFFVAISLLSFSAQAQVERNTQVYNLQAGVGLKGYDPVAVFAEGGGVPTPGITELTLTYKGVTYFFSNVANKDLFLTNPDKYEPTYGGWCAYAMASGSQVDIQPQLVTISGNRAHYFVSNRAKQNFDRDILDHESRADSFWEQISGEKPRK